MRGAELAPASIWWEHLGSSLTLLHEIVEHFREETSFVLQLGTPLPWPEQLDSQLRRGIAPLSERRLFSSETPGEKADPGRFLLERFGSPDLIDGYWPGSSLAEYLCASGDLPLHQSFLRIRGIRTRACISRWVRFVREYNEAAQALEARAVFLLEYISPDPVPEGIDVIPYAAQLYDCQVFCLETGRRLPGEDWERQYAAELTLRLGIGEPETCAALLRQGERLLSDPLQNANAILAEGVSSVGEAFRPREEAALRSAIWQAQVIQFFPVLERHRLGFIDAKERELGTFPPIPDTVSATDPQDLELGELFYMAKNRMLPVTSAELYRLTFLRELRNTLAHLNLASLSQLRKLMLISMP